MDYKRECWICEKMISPEEQENIFCDDTCICYACAKIEDEKENN